MNQYNPASNETRDEGIGLHFAEEKPAPPSRLSMTPMSTSLLMTLFKIEIHLRFIQTQLKIYASLINHYHYALTPNAKQRFDEYQQKYQRECKHFQRLQTPPALDAKRVHDPVESAQKLLQRGMTMRQQLQNYLRERLQQMSHSFRDEADDFLVLTVKNLQKNLAEQENSLPTTALTLNTQTLREHCIALDKTVTHLLEHWQTRVGEWRRQSKDWVSLQRHQPPEAGSIPMMRRGQQILIAVRNRFDHIDPLWRDFPLDNRPSAPASAIEQDSDLNLLSALLKPEAILPALDRAYEFYAMIWLDLQNRVRSLQQKLSKDAGLPVIRELRIILVYERWLAYLPSWNTVPPSHAWFNAVKVQRILTWEKKAFFKQCFEQQSAQMILARLEKEAQSHATTPSWLSALRLQKTRLIAQVTQQEAQLLTNQSTWQRGAASLWVSLTQQPDYQLGQLSFLGGVKQMDQLPRLIPVLSEPLPEPMKKKCASLTGLTFLVIGLSASQYAGYYAHVIGAINRVLSAQITAWFRMGNTLDRGLTRWVIPVLEQVTPKTFTLSQKLRTDELSLLEHDRFMQWCNGLVINSLLAWKQPWLYPFMGYVLATAAGEAAMKGVDHCARYRPIKTESLNFLKVAVHIAVYAPAYQLGVHWAIKLAPPKTVRMPLAEALRHFGLSQPPSTEQAIKKHYRRLSLLFHPDKCQGENCENATAKMALLTEARNTLLEQVLI
ncbi:MAG: J domain-containing protein [Proteobacteria bacterium]|nr:J domain-containing protein [Pseudomonadota bacterium]